MLSSLVEKYSFCLSLYMYQWSPPPTSVSVRQNREDVGDPVLISHSGQAQTAIARAVSDEKIVHKTTWAHFLAPSKSFAASNVTFPSPLMLATLNLGVVCCLGGEAAGLADDMAPSTPVRGASSRLDSAVSSAF